MGKPSRKRKHQPRIGDCAYCGSHGEITVDHVVPRCLFRTRASSFIKVPACRPCNAAKSETEDDLRDFLALSYRSERHPNHQYLLEASARSTLRNSSPTGRRVKWVSRPISLVDRGRVRDLIVVPHDPDPMLACVDYVARGLYHAIYGQRVPENVEVIVRYMGHHEPSASGLFSETFELAPSGRIRDREGVLDVLFWSFLHASAPFLFLALDFVYEVGFMAYIGPEDRMIVSDDTASGARGEVA